MAKRDGRERPEANSEGGSAAWRGVLRPGRGRDDRIGEVEGGEEGDGEGGSGCV